MGTFFHLFVCMYARLITKNSRTITIFSITRYKTAPYSSSCTSSLSCLVICVELIAVTNQLIVISQNILRMIKFPAELSRLPLSSPHCLHNILFPLIGEISACFDLRSPTKIAKGLRSELVLLDWHFPSECSNSLPSEGLVAGYIYHVSGEPSSVLV
ncbi:uncharacterized protein RAG0_06241 [Rhynchosporium agropyri]|uniref:Uncharacterized protein n=1 Tax=Rhynchosporium agropyri TaxID=914238 RepID=A0A1E1KGC5_9HELO|nr:uncharacterized protein RAG0_06241 [Rhynchosporium agropyri]